MSDNPINLLPADIPELTPELKQFLYSIRPEKDLERRQFMARVVIINNAYIGLQINILYVYYVLKNRWLLNF